MNPSKTPRSRFSLSLDARLKTAVLRTAKSSGETLGDLVDRALADYLERRRAESEQSEPQSTQKAERVHSQNQTNTTHE